MQGERLEGMTFKCAQGMLVARLSRNSKAPTVSKRKTHSGIVERGASPAVWNWLTSRPTSRTKKVVTAVVKGAQAIVVKMLTEQGWRPNRYRGLPERKKRLVAGESISK
jgi:hypothetical protein